MPRYTANELGINHRYTAEDLGIDQTNTGQNIAAGILNPYISAANLTKNLADRVTQESPIIHNVLNARKAIGLSDKIPQIKHDNGWSYWLANLGSLALPWGAGSKGASLLGKAAQKAIPALKSVPSLVKGATKLAGTGAGVGYATAEDEKNRAKEAGFGAASALALGGAGATLGKGVNKLTKNYVESMPFVRDLITKTLGEKHNIPSREKAHQNLINDLVAKFNSNKAQSKELYNAAFKSVPSTAKMTKKDIEPVIDMIKDTTNMREFFKEVKADKGTGIDPQKLKFWASEQYHKGTRNFQKGFDTNYDHRAIHGEVRKVVNSFLKKHGDLNQYNAATRHYIESIAPFRNNKNFTRLEKELLKRGSKYSIPDTLDVPKIIRGFKSTPEDSSMNKLKGLVQLLGSKKGEQSYRDIMLADFVDEKGRVDLKKLVKRVGEQSTETQRKQWFKDFNPNNIEKAVDSYKAQLKKTPSKLMPSLIKFSPHAFAVKLLSELLHPFGKALYHTPKSIKDFAKITGKLLPKAGFNTKEQT